MVRPKRHVKATSMASVASVAPALSPPVQLDDIDLRLLRELSDDARKSQRALGRELGMSAPALAARIARLERLGVIKGYTTRIDWQALGFTTVVYINVTIDLGYEMGEVMNQLMTIPEVEDVLIVTGNIDMVVRARVRDHAHLRTFLQNAIWDVEGILRTDTALSVAESPPKDIAASLLDILQAQRQGQSEAQGSG
jgi:Lrp/AsnC family transcriptional regulator, leucine-responsive regulatory protein